MLFTKKDKDAILKAFSLVNKELKFIRENIQGVSGAVLLTFERIGKDMTAVEKRISELEGLKACAKQSCDKPSGICKKMEQVKKSVIKKTNTKKKNGKSN